MTAAERDPAAGLAGGVSTVLDGEPDPDGRVWISAADAGRLAAELARLRWLERYTAGLEEALRALGVHDFTPTPHAADWCVCTAPRSADNLAVHRTPARVRAELAGEPR